jgi:hypothetical protein
VTARTAIDTDDTGDWAGCWCCGAQKPETRLLRLGARPQAAVCVECVTHLRHRARAHDDPPVLVRQLHTAANRVRDTVMATGLHKRPVIGPALRWINQRSPL